MELQLNNWLLFSVFFGGMLLVTIFMSLQSRHFYTKDVIVRKFSITELELPATAQELVNLIAGIYLLKEDQKVKTLSALKGQLYLDFLFMVFAYGSIFFMCCRVAQKMDTAGHGFFMFLAWLQPLAWACDIIENIYLLQKIKPQPVLTGKKQHRNYLIMEGLKWGSALLASVCGISAVCYFWISGLYSRASLQYFGIVILEIALFLFILYVLKKKQTANPKPF